ncbi:MAG: hypothetical protein ACJ8AG_28450 [Ktedonobacteraceae bacterium]
MQKRRQTISTDFYAIFVEDLSIARRFFRVDVRVMSHFYTSWAYLSRGTSWRPLIGPMKRAIGRAVVIVNN